MYDLLAEAAESKLRAGEQPEPNALMELEEVFQSAEWCERFSATFVKMARGTDIAELYALLSSSNSFVSFFQAPLLVHREVIELVDAMRHQLPTCQQVHQTSGVKTVVESLAKNFADDEELDNEEKKELALFFQDFLGRV